MTTPLIEAIARALCKSQGEPDNCAKFYTESAQAALTAITEAGYAVVPVEPTEAMIEVGADLLDSHDCIDEEAGRLDLKRAYSSMISAAQGDG